MKTIEQNNADFGKRVRVFHRSDEGQALRRQLIEIHRWVRPLVAPSGVFYLNGDKP